MLSWNNLTVKLSEMGTQGNIFVRSWTCLMKCYRNRILFNDSIWFTCELLSREINQHVPLHTLCFRSLRSEAMGIQSIHANTIPLNFSSPCQRRYAICIPYGMQQFVRTAPLVDSGICFSSSFFLNKYVL